MAGPSERQPNAGAQPPSPDDAMIERARQQIEQAEQQARNLEPTKPTPENTPAHSDRTDDLPADFFEGYEVVREIHRGGQGVVYQAIQVATKRTVALKALLEGPFAGPGARERFKREIELIAGLDHPNIVKVLDSGVRENRYFYAMDYIRGMSLDQFVVQSRLSIEQILATFAKICEAIDYAHRRGIVHRDLKPSNILVDHRGEPHVVDFGMAKTAGRVAGEDRPLLISLTGQVMGTLPYMSPEQARGDPDSIDSRTDVYSLGVILYQLLTGRFPYQVIGQMRDVLDHILSTEPQRPSTIRRNVHGDLETIVLKALAKEPLRRYQSASELGRDLAHYLAGEAIEAKRDSGWYVLRKKLGRHRKALTYSLALAFLVGVAGYLAYESHTAKENLKTTKEKLQEYEDRPARERVREQLAVAQKKDRKPARVDGTGVDWESTVCIPLDKEPKSLFPLWTTSKPELILRDLVFESLFRLDANLEWQRNERIAEIKDDGDPTVKLVKLKPGLQWQKGGAVSIDDVIFSWDWAVSDKITSSKHDSAARIIRWEKVDDRQARCVLKEADANWRESLSFPLLPRHYYQPLIERALILNDEGTNAASREAGLPDETTTDPVAQLERQPLGSGPYLLRSWSAGEIVLERSEYYSGDKPYIKQLVFRQIKKPESRLAEFLAGRLDLFPMSAGQYAKDQFDEAFRVRGSTFKVADANTPFQFIWWNCNPGDGSLFGDRRVRRAMAHAINMDRLIVQCTQNLGMPCYGPARYGGDDFDMESRRFRFDVKIAGRLLDEAGWTLGSDGRRYKRALDKATSKSSMKELFFTLEVYVDAQLSKAAAELIRKDLQKVGVVVAIRQISGSRYDERTSHGGFEAIISAMEPSTAWDQWRDFFSSQGQNNAAKYSNPKVDELFDAARAAQDPSLRAATYKQVNRLIYEDQPMTFLFHEPALWAQSHRLEGVEFSPRGPYLFDPGIRGWWVPASAP